MRWVHKLTTNNQPFEDFFEQIKNSFWFRRFIKVWHKEKHTFNEDKEFYIIDFPKGYFDSNTEKEHKDLFISNESDTFLINLKIPYRVMRSFFLKSVKKSIKYIKSVLKEHESIEDIICVGGFSSCEFLFNSIKQEFESKKYKGMARKVLRPPDSDSVIVIGASYPPNVVKFNEKEYTISRWVDSHSLHINSLLENNSISVGVVKSGNYKPGSKTTFEIKNPNPGNAGCYPLFVYVYNQKKGILEIDDNYFTICFTEKDSVLHVDFFVGSTEIYIKTPFEDYFLTLNNHYVQGLDSELKRRNSQMMLNEELKELSRREDENEISGKIFFNFFFFF